jgi:predicted DNA-binding ArsR family transcriptional regulator
MIFNLFENEIKITNLKSGENIYILFERENTDYYVFLKSKEEVEENLDRIYKELNEEYAAPLDLTKFLEGYMIIEGKISDLKHINDLIKLS